MRWWLALAFAAIASLTALSVAEFFTSRTENALRGQGENLIVGQSVSVAHAVFVALEQRDRATARQITERRPYSMWVFDPKGKLLTSALSRGVPFEDVPGGRSVLRSTLDHGRDVRAINHGNTFVVGLRLRDRAGAVVTYAQRPELQAQLGIVHDQILRAALFAVLVGAVVGLLVAPLIAGRRRRIARAAAAIEAGAFDTPLQPRFHDELGELAASIDQMRRRLRDSFRDLEAQ